MSRDELMRLEDIEDALSSIADYASRAADFEVGRGDRLLQDAVMFRLAVIGEAVKNLSDETYAKEPEIDWSAWAGLRDIISHSYFRIDTEIIWDTVDRDVPTLAAAVERLLN